MRWEINAVAAVMQLRFCGMWVHVALCMQPGQKGVLIREVEPTAEAAAQIRKGDVLLSFDGIDIANDGTVQFR